MNVFGVVLAFVIYIILTLLFMYIYKVLSNKDLSEEELRNIYKERKSVVLRNASPRETVIHTKILLEDTKEELKIVSGSFNDILYGRLDIRTLLTEAVTERGLKLKMYVGPGYKKEQMDFFKSLKKRFGNVINIYVLNYYPERHFIVSGKYFRIEEVHKPNAKEFKALVGRDRGISQSISKVFSSFEVENRGKIKTEV